MSEKSFRSDELSAAKRGGENLLLLAKGKGLELDRRSSSPPLPSLSLPVRRPYSTTQFYTDHLYSANTLKSQSKIYPNKPLNEPNLESRRVLLTTSKP